jgi:predicted HicB family RNase H-like nuclease
MNDLLQYKGYYATIHFSAEDEVFFGKILGIDDLVNFEGASVKELKKSFYEAVDDYLKTCKELGKEPNKAYKGSFNVRIPVDMHKDAAVFSSILQVSLNDFIKTAIGYALMNKEDVSRKLQSGIQ